MTDTPPEETPEQRAAGHTEPPQFIHFAAPPGSVLYAAVQDEDGLAGYVWVTTRQHIAPRAGLVLLNAARRADPSVEMQDDLGMLTLSVEPDADAYDVMEYLVATRDGQGGKTLIQDYSTAANLDAVRAMAL